MSKNQELKKQKVNDFQEVLDKKSFIFMDYEGIKVEEITEIRNKLRENEATIKVMKNTLFEKVVEAKKMDFDKSIFKGMTAVAFGEDEKFIDISKSIYQAEKAEKVKIKAGFFEGNVLDDKEVRKYAALLSKEQMYGVLVGCLQGVVANLVYVLDDIKSNKEEEKNKETSS